MDYTTLFFKAAMVISKAIEMIGAPQNSLFKFIIVALAFTALSNKPNLCLCRCPDYESEALLTFKSSSNESSGSFNSWVNGTDCCMWDGIACNNEMNHVEIIGYFGSSLSIQAGIISDSLCNLHFLTILNFDGEGLTGTLPSCLGKLSYLWSLYLSGHRLSGEIPSTFCELTNLTYLDLSGNQLNGSLPYCLGNLSSLTDLSLKGNKFSGNIPYSIGSLSSLNNLYISDNSLSGPIPPSIGSLSSLNNLNISDNSLSGPIPPSIGSLSSLNNLYISHNSLSGPIPPSMGNLSSLRWLDVSFNKLTGTFPSSFTHLHSLDAIIADGNHFSENILSSAFPSSIGSLSLTLNQTISETFFHNLTGLHDLHLSNCVLNISTAWIPEFQLWSLTLQSCYIGGLIPGWISTQISLHELELTDNNLYGEIPSWLFSPPMEFLTLSRNQLQGKLFGSDSPHLKLLDLSRNELSGTMPSVWPPYLGELRLNDNRFSGNIPSSLGSLSGLSLINLAKNQLNGTIPPSLANSHGLRVMNLGGNSFEGTVPLEFDTLNLFSFVIGNNKLNGVFPSSILNFSELKVLDIGHNSFKGQIPKTIGILSELRILIVKGNLFSGSIPPEIGQLKQLQILDFSSNNLSASIPPSIASLQAMSVPTEDGNILQEDGMEFVGHYSRGSYQDDLNMNPKGTDLYYPYILSTLTSISLSNNQLNGDIPLGFGKLKGLRFLNLSMNNLSGVIPHSMGDMTQLEALDLSSNRFSGLIPSELQSLNYLAYLNLSSNNFSGSIPQGGQLISFENTSYSENPNLQGCPLPKNCSWPKYRRPPPNSGGEGRGEDDREQIPWYQIGVGWSYGAGFLIVVILLLSIREKWRKKYFKGVDDVLKFLCPSLRNREF